MAVTWPNPTYTDGQLIAAADLNIIRDNLNDLHATGTWTPTYYGGTTAGTTTHAVQVGSYTRIGDVTFFSIYITWTAATGTGNARISLPSTSRNTTNLRSTPTVLPDSVTYSSGPPKALILPNTNYIDIYTTTSNAGSAAIAVEAAGGLVITGFYFV